jgi:hypothetical protein
MAADDANQGLQVAHTPAENPGAAAIEADPDRAAKVGTTRAIAESAMASLAQELVPAAADPEQQSLMLDEIDEQQSLFAGPVRHVAETISAARNGRGRPKGSQNKASREFAETLMRMGYRHPGLNLAALANADPVRLALEIAGQTVEPGDPAAQLVKLAKEGKLDGVAALVTKAHELVLKANAELMPYFESKRAQELKVSKHVLGVMMIGDMQVERPDDGGVMDLTRAEKPT